MTTWDNLFDGYDALSDAYSDHTHMYTDVAGNGSEFNMYSQFVEQAPTDVKFIFTVFHGSVVPLVIIASMLFVFLMPFFKRPQRW